MSVQKVLLPGIVIAIICVVLLTSLLGATAGRARSNQATGKANIHSSNGAGGCSISNSYPQSIQQWCSVIERYASENRLDPNLVSAIMLQESSGRPDAYSRSGAVGLLQVMPRDGLASSFVCPNGPCFAGRPSMQELFDPEFNISYGTRLLASLVEKYGDLREALKAYGPKDVGYYYADLVLGTMNNHR